MTFISEKQQNMNCTIYLYLKYLEGLTLLYSIQKLNYYAVFTSDHHIPKQTLCSINCEGIILTNPRENKKILTLIQMSLSVFHEVFFSLLGTSHLKRKYSAAGLKSFKLHFKFSCCHQKLFMDLCILSRFDKPLLFHI